MASLLFHLVFWLINQGSPRQIPERNQAKREAEQAYRQGQYRMARQRYEALTQGSIFPEVGVLLNLAHASFLVGDTAAARRYYARLFRSSDARLASTAWAQAALLDVRSGDTARALQQLRQALTLNPDNEPARYNYEFLRYRFRPRAQTPPAPKPPAPTNASPPPGRQDVLRSEQRRQTLTRLRRYNLTEAQAQQILDALNANEAQFIQQRRRPASGTAEVEKPW
jgi:tetratricopeptide (TPR) repeat protein